jgi:hypothetical protein
MEEFVENVRQANERGTLARYLLKFCDAPESERRPNRLEVMDEYALKRFHSILALANSMGVLHKFLGRILYLLQWGGNPEVEYRVFLSHDFAEASMYFTIQGRNARVIGPWDAVIHGGLIYWGPKEPKQDNYSHTGPQDEPYWSVHT